MYYGGNGVEWWGWLLMALGMVAFWGVVIWGIVSLVRWGTASRTSTPPSGDESPEALLNRRFAAGEINEDEYRHRLDVLHGGVRVGTG
jgi:putative membrane protein